MTKDEALRLALEVLEDLGMKHYENTGEVLYKNTYTAIKAALEAKDEPVALAWAEGYRMGIADERTSEANIGIAGFNAKVEPARENPYVTTPLQQEVKDEPVAWMDASRFEELRNGFTVMTTLTKKKAFFDDIAIYTTPPPVAEPHKRTWVGLTETEVDECYESVMFNPDIEPTRVLVYQAIETKLRDKNI